MKYKTPAIVSTLLLVAILLPVAQAATPYGPTTATETLWSIAEHARPDNSITVQQMMVAIQVKNPLAFNDGNLNGLKEGAYLDIPSLEEIKKITHEQAVKETALNNQAWKESESNIPLNASARLLKERLQREIAVLSERLQQEQQRSQNLTEQIKQERQKNEALSLQLKQLPLSSTTTKTPTVPNTASDNEKINAELAELKQLLDDRDTHIQNLQASLREASITIKRQYAESVALHKQLTAIDPNAKVELPPEPNDLTQTPAKPNLTLTEVPPSANTISNNTTQSQSPNIDNKGNPIVFADQLNSALKPPNSESEKANQSAPNTLKELIQQQAAQAAQKPATNEPMNYTPSKFTLGIALMALLFVLAALWRSYAQRRALQQEEQRLQAALAEDEHTFIVNSPQKSAASA